MLRFSPPTKRRLARSFSFRFRAVAAALEAIPAGRLERCVLFLSLRPHTREARLAEAARLAGWEPFLIHAGDLKFDADKYFLVHARIGGLLQLLLISWFFRGPLIHLFAPDGAQAYLLCATKIRPLILDINDTCKSHLIQSTPRIWEQCERDAIRTSDGMTHRDLRVKYLHELYGYPLPRHNMLVVDVGQEKVSQGKSSPSSQVKRSGEIRVVSVGWVGKGDNSIMRTIRALCADRIHVHMYTNPFQRETDPEIAGYWKLQKQSEYFHFEQPVFGCAYWEHLSRYDFGLSVCEPLVFGETPVSVTMDSLQGAGSSRLTDYILAGLGVIISPGLRFQWFMARRYAAVVVSVTPELLNGPRAILESALRQKADARPKNVSAITIRGASRRLGKFYSKVAAGT